MASERNVVLFENLVCLVLACCSINLVRNVLGGHKF